MATRPSPPLSALFLVVFDQKIGYTISWQRAAHGVDLAGVEYKSLPSGLHDKDNDVVYFTHGTLAGTSAFIQVKAGAEHRNAHFAAVGVLASSSDGHSPAWQYVEPLKRLTQAVISDIDDSGPLEDYWKRVTTNPSQQLNDNAWQSLPAELHVDHPARSLTGTLDSLGPLFFPLQRQALLARRVLVLGRPPVQHNCEIVYVLSLLSISKLLHQGKRPLYNVGIADMTTLSETPTWIACTTDAVLKQKTSLYDILIELPGDSATSPRITDAKGNEIRATQRDVRRFLALHRHLWLVDEKDAYQDNDQSRLLGDNDTGTYTAPDVPLECIEPYTWSRVAQRSLSWWASPGEQSAMEEEETDLEHDMLRGLPGRLGDQYDRSATHTGILAAYFTNSTRLVIESAAQVVVESSETTDEQLDVSASALAQAGLDLWSLNDHKFFEAVVELHSGKKAKIVEEPITLCGIRVC